MTQTLQNPPLCSSSDMILTSVHAVQEQDSSGSLILVGVDGVQLPFCSSSDRMLLTSVHAVQEQDSSGSLILVGVDGVQLRFVAALTGY